MLWSRRSRRSPNATARPGADASLGGFGGFFDLKAAGYRDPLLVAANDGVGTKLKLAIDSGRHDGVGIDLVAMCVNDLIVQGAEPLFFLDYFATGRLDSGIAERVIAGDRRGLPQGRLRADRRRDGGNAGNVCRRRLRSRRLLRRRGRARRGADRRRVAAGDVILGLASSGVHSNGFSLVRRLAADKGWKLDRPALFDQDRLLIEALLEPTRIYVKPLLPLVRGGRSPCALPTSPAAGLLENIPRILPGRPPRPDRRRRLAAAAADGLPPGTGQYRAGGDGADLQLRYRNGRDRLSKTM